MHELLQQHLETAQAASRSALLYRDEVFDYRSLWQLSEAFACGLIANGLPSAGRVAIFLPKQPQVVAAVFGSSLAGGVFVPINPLLKPRQVAHILMDCNVRVLVTSKQRLAGLSEVLEACSELEHIVVVEADAQLEQTKGLTRHVWADFCQDRSGGHFHSRIDADMAAILYTSGSTGAPKGVVLSHRNIVAGADSVADYLCNSADDRVLALLPLSFDAGLSQLTTMFMVGGSAVLMDYLLPGDVLQALVRYQVTGLGAVPPIWNQLARLQWPEAVCQRLRYITNTGGAMPVTTTKILREKLPDTLIYLMYGLTEAFRSTYLDPAEVERRPESIGKAIPNAEILLINEKGQRCAAGEPGELVHRGALVAMGYWNAPELTAARFRSAPLRAPELVTDELAVWSGDQLYSDEEGYLYFIGRSDDMIKSSGYRISPTEVEDAAYASSLVNQVAAIGLPHDELGQAILLVFSAASPELPLQTLEKTLLAALTRELPAFMVPRAVVAVDALPLNPNGKIDRKSLLAQYQSHFLT
ncbi:MAG: acyl-CoA ligase (AMP-forming), exosortase A system-associated [Parahaliea sp.]